MKHVVSDANNALVRPAFKLVKVKDGSNKDHLYAYVSDDVDIAFKINQNGNLNILYGTDNTIDGLQDIATKFGLIGSGTAASLKLDIYNNMTKKALGGPNQEPQRIQIGNVELYSPERGFRKPWLNTSITGKGWTITHWPFDAKYQTLFCQIANSGQNYIVATPIMESSILTKTNFNSYISTCLNQEDIMAYDNGHNKIILGIASSEYEAQVLITLLAEWQDHFQSATIPSAGLGKAYHDLIIEYALENQSANLNTIIDKSIGIKSKDTEGLIKAVNLIYPAFNCTDADSARGRLLKMIYHELWIVVPLK